MQLIDYLPLHAEWGVVDWAPLILLRGTEGNKSSLETCANFRAKNYTPCFLGWREYKIRVRSLDFLIQNIGPLPPLGIGGDELATA